jgi:UDPglucose--hexose-1-phosphate uridylyltransferase
MGDREPVAPERGMMYDPDCYFCPTNTRAKGDVNPDYPGIFVFQNDYGLVQEGQPEGPITSVDDNEVQRGGTT